MRTWLLGPSLTAVSLLLTACGQSIGSSASNTSVCVDVPEGQFFQFVDGQLIPVTEAQAMDQEQPPETARRIARTLAGMGYPWVSLEWDGETAKISGIARDNDSRSDAFVAAKAAFEADPVSGPLVQRVINDMNVRDPVESIALRLSDELSEEGLPWLDVVMAGRVATLVGQAPSPAQKDEAYGIGRSTVESDLNAGEIVNIVVDAIGLSDQTDPVGQPLVTLTADASDTECQAAFSQVMAGRDIGFQIAESIVDNSSARLLDALTGVALLCERFDIEIANHSYADDLKADDIDLSQRRASAVRDYMMAYGVNPDALTARGYADTLISAEVTALSEGDAGGASRTEFTVRPRPDQNAQTSP
ncbi:MAG: OmpA family protein [Pseudomonadota bacterium]